VKRWAFFDKSYAIRNLKKDVRDEKFLDWVTKYDKQNHANQVKENMRPFESLFLELGAEILQNVSDLLTANPEDAVQKLRKDVLDTVKQLRQTNDVTKIKQLQTQLKQIESAGGLDKLVPTEGIVFQYKGKTYKLTGLFAPINQLLGSLKYG
jgi:gas vesicle protein